ncbi:AAA family ATPase [Achromobacter pestifer]|uniref:Rad50/SbcC-type AAA domain-containing protein n=1 Tax=Achromobacter pestifer TaxID=1353889 RepID=A0A6S6ZZS5_9BURK|nr:AAA family ATPase [Achromobacter pestifer]CAB3647367.1 hypothetical protein LMG3431_02562 [Achromobacter pestifer]
MRGIRLSSLSVAHFRGINETTLFDFSAPLTLVFAPNGTGKTTMCEATEWLLTGQVERLKEGKGFDATVLRSKFAKETDSPATSADIVIGGQRRFVRRVAEGVQSPATFGSDRANATAYRPHELLALLAPAAAADEAHHLTAINLRQRWLKGTRFLSAEALAALIDTDDETIERRTQVFADLLGIRHLLDAERQCEKFANELSSRLRALNSLVERQSAEADALEQSMAGAEAADPPSTTSARSEANAAAELLATDELHQALEQSSFDDVLGALAAVHGRQRHAVDARTFGAQRVEAQWSMYSTLELAVNEGTALEARLSRSLAEVEEKSRNAAASVAERSSQRAVTSDAARALAAAKDRLSHLSAVLLATLLDTGALDGRPQTLGALSDLYPESQWNTDARAQRRGDLVALETAIGNAADQIQRERLLDAEIAATRTGEATEEELATLRSDVAGADVRARAASTLLDATADPVARLQAAARALLAHDHGVDAAKCPTCSHDWGDAAQLRSAISATLSAAPEFIEVARTAAAVASDAARVARERLDAALAAKNQINVLEKERASLLAAAEARRRESERLGFAEGATPEMARVARLRIDVADALAEFLADCDRLSTTLLGGSDQLLAPEVQVSDLLDQLDKTFSEHDRAIQLRLAGLAKDIEDTIKERDQLRASYASTQQNLRECRQALQQNSADLAALRAAWEEAAPGVDRTDAELSALKTHLAAEAQRLLRAEGHIEAARSAWSAESRRARLRDLRQALQPSLDRQKRMSDQIAASKRARAVFYDAYTTMSRKRVEDLSRVVNPLFARMHANRVFDRINLGDDRDFLHWLADAGGQQLDPGKDFSQGQRQDLALALFLARARSLGGTFFLDEPITHLDDLNRVGLLDILRATVLESSHFLNLVITTSSRALARHLIEKFAGVELVETPEGRARPLRVLELDGNGRSGVRLTEVYPPR